MDDYIREYRRHARAELRFYADQPTLADAVRVAAGWVCVEQAPGCGVAQAVRRRRGSDSGQADALSVSHRLCNREHG